MFPDYIKSRRDTCLLQWLVSISGVPLCPRLGSHIAKHRDSHGHYPFGLTIAYTLSLSLSKARIRLHTCAILQCYQFLESKPYRIQMLTTPLCHSKVCFFVDIIRPKMFSCCLTHAPLLCSCTPCFASDYWGGAPYHPHSTTKLVNS